MPPRVESETATEQLLARINERHGTAYALVRRYAAGQNHGAYAVRDAAGAHFVLKRHRRPEWLPRLEMARLITDVLRGRGAPLPAYVLAGSFPNGWTYWLQTALPGAPPERLTRGQLEAFLAINELQAGRAVSEVQDWSVYVAAVVYDGESGWADSLHRHSPATRALLRRIEALVAGKRDCCANEGDIVHGDVCLDNLLVEDDVLSGVVDWDAAGCGDRVLDLAKLLNYTYDDAPVRDRVRDSILDLRDRDTLEVHLCYAILAQLDWSIRHHSESAVRHEVASAERIVGDLEAAH